MIHSIFKVMVWVSGAGISKTPAQAQKHCIVMVGQGLVRQVPEEQLSGQIHVPVFTDVVCQCWHEQQQVAFGRPNGCERSGQNGCDGFGDCCHCRPANRHQPIWQQGSPLWTSYSSGGQIFRPEIVVCCCPGVQKTAEQANVTDKFPVIRMKYWRNSLRGNLQPPRPQP